MKSLLLLPFFLLVSAFLEPLEARDSPLEIRLVVSPGEPGAIKRMWAEETLYCSKDAVIDASSVAEAAVVSMAGKETTWQVEVKFSERGKAAFAEATTTHAGKQFAILSMGNIIVVARVQRPILGGLLRISGGLTEEEARELAASLTRTAGGKVKEEES